MKQYLDLLERIMREGVEKTGKFRWTEELGGTPEEDTAEEEN